MQLTGFQTIGHIKRIFKNYTGYKIINPEIITSNKKELYNILLTIDLNKKEIILTKI